MRFIVLHVLHCTVWYGGAMRVSYVCTGTAGGERVKQKKT